MSETIRINRSHIEGSDLVFGNQYNQYNYYFNASEIDDLGVISEIFDYILKNKKAGKERDRDFIDVEKKIKINFPDHIPKINEFMTKAYEKLNLIEEIFSRMDANDQDDVHNDILSRYEELKIYGMDNYTILFKLQNQYVPTGKEKNPHYRSMALALVLFFFEDCTWGEKTEKELSRKRK